MERWWSMTPQCAPTRVLFICSRNQWRSPTAEAVFADAAKHLKELDQLVTITREIKVLKRNSVEDVVKQVQRWKGAEDLQARIQKLREALDALDEA